MSCKVCSESDNVASKSHVNKEMSKHNVSQGVDENDTKNLERCFLCTRELVEKHGWVKKGVVRKTSDCYPGGDYHDFHEGAGWVISLLLPNTSLGRCYIDVFAPKEDVFSNEKMKQIDRIYISRNCSDDKCQSRNKLFEDIFLLQPMYKYSYVLKLGNKSGNNEI